MNSAFLMSILARRHGGKSTVPLMTTGQRVADWVTAVVGSWPFIIVQAALLGIWVGINYFGFTSFDPAPFIGLNLVLSFEAAFTAPFILMSQNRQGEIDRHTLEEDLNLDRESAELLRQIIATLRRGGRDEAPSHPQDD